MSKDILRQIEAAAMREVPVEYALHNSGNFNIPASTQDVTTYDRLQQYRNVEEQSRSMNMRDVQHQSDLQMHMDCNAWNIEGYIEDGPHATMNTLNDSPKLYLEYGLNGSMNTSNDPQELHTESGPYFPTVTFNGPQDPYAGNELHVPTNAFNELREPYDEQGPNLPTNISNKRQKLHAEKGPDVPADTFSGKLLVSLQHTNERLHANNGEGKGTEKNNDSLSQTNSSHGPRLTLEATKPVAADRSWPGPYPSFPQSPPHSEGSSPLPRSGHGGLSIPNWNHTPYITPPPTPSRSVSSVFLLPSGWQPTPEGWDPHFIISTGSAEPPKGQQFDSSYRKFSRDSLQMEFAFFYKCCAFFNEQIERILDKARRRDLKERMRDNVLRHGMAANGLSKKERWAKDIQQTNLKPYLLLTLARLGYEVLRVLNIDFVTKSTNVGSMVEEVHKVVDPFTLRPSNEYKHMEAFCILLTQNHASSIRRYWAPLVELYTRKTYNEIAGKADG
ncbi:hypothetical protein B7494_g6597 [Chlorociboria aeruginascens]|nr:hypothetical protein B7494_g6597 [Chlorociboria aeruginascens]